MCVLVSVQACTCIHVRNYTHFYNYVLLGEFVTSHVTLWLAVDLATESGRKLLRNGLEYIVRNSTV